MSGLKVFRNWTLCDVTNSVTSLKTNTRKEKIRCYTPSLVVGGSAGETHEHP